jgi:hypothetical protein
MINRIRQPPNTRGGQFLPGILSIPFPGKHNRRCKSMNAIQKIINSFVQGPIYLVLFGLVFFGIGAGLAFKQYVLERDGAEAQGKVVSLDQSCDDDGCTYSPVVSFQTRGGKSVTFDSTYSSSPPAYDIGETVTVIYPPDAPEKAVIKGEGAVFRIIFMAVGGVVIAFGLYMFGGRLHASFSPGSQSL